jgi:hypothetical protein
MPIEIRELNIRITVSEDQSPANNASSQQPQESRESFVAECVEQVLDIISKTHER